MLRTAFNTGSLLYCQFKFDTGSTSKAKLAFQLSSCSYYTLQSMVNSATTTSAMDLPTSCFSTLDFIGRNSVGDVSTEPTPSSRFPANIFGQILSFFHNRASYSLGVIAMSYNFSLLKLCSSKTYPENIKPSYPQSCHEILPTSPVRSYCHVRGYMPDIFDQVTDQFSELGSVRLATLNGHKCYTWRF